MYSTSAPSRSSISMIVSAGDSRRSSTSRLYATPSTSTLAPRSAVPARSSARAVVFTTYAGIDSFTSPASSINRVATPNCFAFQLR